MSRSSLVRELTDAGVLLAATLPDQWLSTVLDELDAEPSIRHVRLTREEEGVGICIGAGLARRRAVLICQNAGVLLSMNALAGGTHHHRSPIVVVAVQRGLAGDPYPYQAYKGLVTAPVLRAAGIPTLEVRKPEDLGVVGDAFVRAEAARSAVVVLAERDALLPQSEPSRGNTA